METKAHHRVMLTRHEGTPRERWIYRTLHRSDHGLVRWQRFGAGEEEGRAHQQGFADAASQIRAEDRGAPFTLSDEPHLDPCTFHPRIYRPCPCLDVQRHYHGDEERHALHAIHAMLRRLDAVLSFVSPDPANKDVFGPEIRLLLISACTEVEAEWKGVMRANGTSKTVLTVKDYVKLAGPMRLADWSVELINHPAWGPVSPFAVWGTTPPAHLPWYDAYNGAKHDRQPGLRSSTLEHTVSAVAGLVVMYAAQFGPPRERDVGVTFSTTLGIAAQPDWPVEEVYYGLSNQPDSYTAVPVAM